MTKKIFNQIAEGLQEALVVAQGDNVAALVERLNELHRVLRLTDCSVDEDACLEAAAALADKHEEWAEAREELRISYSVCNQYERALDALGWENDDGDPVDYCKRWREEYEATDAALAERNKRIADLERRLRDGPFGFAPGAEAALAETHEAIRQMTPFADRLTRLSWRIAALEEHLLFEAAHAVLSSAAPEVEPLAALAAYYRARAALEPGEKP